MTEEAETAVAAVKKKPAKKAVKKPAAKKAAPAKKAAKKKKTVAKKSSTTAASAAPAAKATTARGKRGRPAAKKTGARRGKKGKQFAYLLLTPQEDGSQKASTINGPFSSDKDALDDASIMADEKTTIVLFRESKRGKVQKSTKFVAGR